MRVFALGLLRLGWGSSPRVRASLGMARLGASAPGLSLLDGACRPSLRASSSRRIAPLGALTLGLSVGGRGASRRARASSSRRIAPLGALALGLIALVVGGCGSAPRARVASAVERGELEVALAEYERFRGFEGPDDDLLGRIAALVLEREAGSEEEGARRAAVQQLALAGTAGMPVLKRLAQREGADPVRLGALEALAKRGDLEAQLALRALADSDDPDVVAAAVLGMDAALDRARLLALTRSSDAPLRARAIRALAPAAGEPEVARVLAEAARVDADPRVRGAAVWALGESDAAGLEMLRERLSDPDVGVRLAAVAGLARHPEGRATLASLLEAAPDMIGVTAARLLLTIGEPDDPFYARAAALLEASLASDDIGLRAQAAIAFASLPRVPSVEPLRAALATEADPGERVLLALALLRHDRAAARDALRPLLGADGMPRVQAAALLAGEGDADARAVLADVLASDEPSILRRTAARALARDAMSPDAARRALTDADPLVRIYAAGGILAASTR